VHGFALPPASNPNLFGLALDGTNLAGQFGDVRDADAVRTCVEEVRPEIVFHMAAQALVRPSYDDPVGTYATNVMGTVHVLEALRQTAFAQALVVVTSDKCYENQEWLWPYRETEPMGGHDPYSSSKGCAELVTSAYRRSYFGKTNCRIATARAGNVIGGGDWSTDRLIADLVRDFSQGTSTEIRSPLRSAWQHVLDAWQATCSWRKLSAVLMARPTPRLEFSGRQMRIAGPSRRSRMPGQKPGPGKPLARAEVRPGTRRTC
jgi:CDP-glucose 4,6-dehydratase